MVHMQPHNTSDRLLINPHLPADITPIVDSIVTKMNQVLKTSFPLFDIMTSAESQEATALVLSMHRTTDQTFKEMSGGVFDAAVRNTAYEEYKAHFLAKLQVINTAATKLQPANNDLCEKVRARLK
tara:strand:+ start:2619 stop:2996 length:378 start_codon:yes stop_codon:yes gene_type:complete